MTCHPKSNSLLINNSSDPRMQDQMFLRNIAAELQLQQRVERQSTHSSEKPADQYKMPRLLPVPFLPLPLRLPTSSHSQFHTSTSTAKKFKPQKPFLLPGQTPGQQRQERKRQEKITQAIKRGRLEQGYVSPGPSAVDRRRAIPVSIPSSRRAEERGPSGRWDEAVEDDSRPFGLKATPSDSASPTRDRLQVRSTATASSTRSDRPHVTGNVDVKRARAEEDNVDGWGSKPGKLFGLKPVAEHLELDNRKPEGQFAVYPSFILPVEI